MFGRPEPRNGAQREERSSGQTEERRQEVPKLPLDATRGASRLSNRILTRCSTCGGDTEELLEMLYDDIAKRRPHEALEIAMAVRQNMEDAAEDTAPRPRPSQKESFQVEGEMRELKVHIKSLEEELRRAKGKLYKLEDLKASMEGGGDSAEGSQQHRAICKVRDELGELCRHLEREARH